MTLADSPGSRDELMASVDEDRGEPRLVIADISRDDAWVSMSADTATPLVAMR